MAVGPMVAAEQQLAHMNMEDVEEDDVLVYCAHFGCRNPSVVVPAANTDIIPPPLVTPPTYLAAIFKDMTIPQMMDHISADHLSCNSYPCLLCARPPFPTIGRSFSTRELYREHQIAAHPQDPPTPLADIRSIRTGNLWTQLLAFAIEYVRLCPPPVPDYIPPPSPPPPGGQFGRFAARRARRRRRRPIRFEDHLAYARDLQHEYGVALGHEIYTEFLRRLRRLQREGEEENWD